MLKPRQTNLYFVCALALMLSACAGTKESHPTIDPLGTIKPINSSLELPPDLIESSSDEIVAQQKVLSEDDVVPVTIGITVVEDSNGRWLEVDAPAEDVWPKLVRYWVGLGATLVVNDPKAGIMETEWVKQQDEGDGSSRLGKSNLIVSILKDITDQSTSLDKYTLRIERKAGEKTGVFISHRGSKKIQIGTTSVATFPEWEWVETEEDPEKVRIVLQSISYNLNPENA